MRLKPFNKWQAYTVTVRLGFGVGPDFAPWTSSHKLHGVPKGCPRVVDLIDVAWIAALSKISKLPPDEQVTANMCSIGLFADLSQAVQRKPWSRDFVRTLHIGSLIYSFEADCVFGSHMLLRMQGFPANFASSGSTRSIQALAGESWSLPAAASAIYAAFLCDQGPWWKPTF
jgi:hypothetical protein